MREFFRKCAHHASLAVGSAWAFLIALAVILTWAITGPLFGYSDTWQLVVNTGTTIITFLMVFLIQNTQNRDATVIHLKLDELIRTTSHARDQLVDLEDLSDEELDRLQREFHEFRSRCEERVHRVTEEVGRRKSRQRKKEPASASGDEIKAAPEQG